MAHLGENRYGKSRVRVMKVVRHETYHAMKEWNVRVLLHGDFETCFKHRLFSGPRVARDNS
jgi:urate oxidase